MKRGAPLTLAALLCLGVCAATADAATYRVGPGRTYTKTQDVVPLLNPGDIVEVDGNATYPGDLTFLRPGTAASPIVVRGTLVAGKRPVISGGTNTVHFRTDAIGSGADHYVFEGFEVTGGTGRCIFHQSDDLTLRDLVVHDCPKNGILGADWGSGSLTLEHSEVYRTGSGSSSHQIYIGMDEADYPSSVFRMRFNWVHDGLGGNNVKSRATRNEIYYNRIEGAYYHELELIGADPSCCVEDAAREDSDVVGNLIIKKPPPYGPNPDFFAVRVGGDGTGQSWGRYRFVNNTFVMGGIAAFRIFDGLESIEMHNNVFYRYGGQPVTITRTVEAVWKSGAQMSGSNNWMTTGSTTAPPAWTGTLSGADPGFTNATAGDYSPAAGSALIDAGKANPTSAVGFAFPGPLFPPGFHPPGLPGVFGAPNPRPADAKIDIGAYERALGGASAPLGRSNVLWQHQGTGSLYLWFMNGAAQAGGTPLSPGGVSNTQWQVRGTADFSGDGKNDILWQHQGTGELYAWTMNGATQTAGAYLSPAQVSDTQWQIRGLADFSGDGKPDVLWQHQGTGDLYLWTMNGTTRTGGASLSPARVADTQWRVVGVGDFNGDGKADLLWHHQVTGDVYVWFMNGMVQAGGASLGRVSSTQWQIRQVGDFNADGKSDILWHHQTAGTLYAWYLNGTTRAGESYLSPSAVTDTSWKVAQR